MVTTGFSRIHVAKYAAAGGTVTYSDVRELARARNMDISVDTTEESNFYANNALAECEPAAFKSGKVKLGVDGLSAEEEAFVLGIDTATNKMSVGEKEIPVVKFGKSMNPPYLGIGAVKRMQLNGKVSYRPVILTKGRFAVPPEAAETQEERINWQTQDLEATIMRDDTAEENWKIIPVENMATEDEAVAFIVAVLGGKKA